MKKINITKEQVMGFAKNCCKLVFGAMVIAGAYYSRDTSSNNTRRYTTYIGAAGYSDAVNVIVNSSMFDSSKTRAIEMLRRDGDSGYYNAVIAAVNSSMFDSNKIESIEALSKK